MKARTQLRLASGLVTLGMLIPLAWYWALRPFLRGEGPSPGAGAQYVFVLLPSVALAAVALAAGCAVAYVAGRHAGGRHNALGMLLMFVGAVGATVLAVWLARVAFGMATVAS